MPTKCGINPDGTTLLNPTDHHSISDKGKEVFQNIIWPNYIKPQE
jgi:hypothetical protein